MALDAASDWEHSMDANMSTLFAVLPSSIQHFSTISDVAFCKAINLRVDISNISAFVGCYKVSSEPFLALDIEKLSFSKLEEVKPTLKSVLKPEELEHVEDKFSSNQE